MRNIQQLFDPWVCIIFLKHGTNLDKHLSKSQNLTLYDTDLNFFYTIAKVSLTHVSVITLNHLNPIDEIKRKAVYIKNSRVFCVSDLYFSKVSIFQLLTPKQKFSV